MTDRVQLGAIIRELSAQLAVAKRMVSIDGALARQLSRSMEINAKLNNRIIVLRARIAELEEAARPMKRLTRESRRILAEMDVDQAMKNVAVLGFIPDTREIALAGLHKARLMAGRAFSKPQREESRRWLRDNGFRIPGQP